MTMNFTQYLNKDDKLAVMSTDSPELLRLAIYPPAGFINIYLFPEQLVILSAEIHKHLDSLLSTDGSQRETPSDELSPVHNYVEVVQRFKGQDNYDTIGNMAARIHQLESTIQKWVRSQR